MRNPDVEEAEDASEEALAPRGGEDTASVRSGSSSKTSKYRWMHSLMTVPSVVFPSLDDGED